MPLSATHRIGRPFRSTMETLVFYIILIYQFAAVQGLATDVRLSHGQNSEVEFRSYEGAIEVLVNDTWGPVLRHGVDSTTAKTVCKILGYGLTGFVVEQFSFIGYPLLRSISCVGNETSIEDCTQDPLSESYKRFDAPGVHCFPHVFNELRLVDGEGPNNGTVNIKMDGRWGLLCGFPTGNHFATPKVDTVICRTLGYQRTIDPAPRFGQYVDIFNGWLDIDKITCSGSETNLNQCTIRKGTLRFQPRCNTFRAVYCVTDLGEFCTSDDICVETPNAACMDNICKCKPGYVKSISNTCIGITQSIRLLTFTEHANEGFLQVFVNGNWTLVNGDDYTSFTNTTAKMICKTLGFGPTGFSSWYYTESPGPDYSAKYGLFECNGNETSLEECFNPDEYPQRTVPSVRGIVTTLHCFDLRIDDVRITGQPSYNGIVEVKIGDRWGTVCEIHKFPQIRSTSDITKEVVCNSVRNGGHGGYRNTVYESSVYLPWLSLIECDDIYDDINQCRFITGPHRYSDLGNFCAASSIRRLFINCPPIQLINGTSKNVGRIEVGFYGQQYTICGNRMNMALANVTCTVKGFSSVGNIYYGSEFGKGTADIFPYSIQCAGNEASLESCQISNTTDVLCLSGSVGGVECLIHIGDPCFHRPFACSSISNAECKLIRRCYCKDGFTNVTTRHCGAIYDFRLMRAYEDQYEGIVEVKVKDVWMVVSTEDSTLSNKTASILCETLGISDIGYTVTSNQEVYFEKNITLLEDPMYCFGHEQHAMECDIPSGNNHVVTVLDAEWPKIRCSHCKKGFYGPNCTKCNCNGQPCNVSTGECMCAPGWEGDTCSADIDECSMGIDTCAEFFECMNTHGSFSCECGPGTKYNGSHCEACEGMYYGYNCSYVCDCEVEHSDQTTTNRSCDIVTGNCACLPKWTGSRCNQSSSSGSTDVKMMIIIISSATVGFILLGVIITVCVCKYRKSGPKGEGKSPMSTRGTVNTEQK